MSEAFTSAGTTLAVAATLPATFDAAGYAAATFTDVGEVTEIPEYGREYTLVTHNPIATRQTVKRKGSFNAGSLAIPMARVTNDEGQAILREAEASDNSYAFRVTLADGTRQYYTAQVMSYTTNVGNVDSITTATVNIEIDRDIVEVGPDETPTT